MLCKSPVTLGTHPVRCGQCVPCRINKRRTWVARLLLEQTQHADSTFITLTYDDERLLDGGNLLPKDLQDWLKRFRKATSPLRLRYYAVGEYGDLSQRPHYHLALFGYPNCERGQSFYSSRRSRCCPRCDLVSDTWGHGHILLGELTTESAQYIAGYVLKKMTNWDDDRLLGRHPEFARMSLRPGIGSPALQQIVDTWQRFNLDYTEGDVPSALRFGKKIMPLGRYLRRQLRELLGLPPNAPQEVLQELQAEMLDMQLLSKTDPEARSATKLLQEKYKGKVASIEARSKIFKKENKL